MVIKICVICGEEFECKGNDITCDTECSAERKRIYDRRYKHDYNHKYYLANSERWKWYKKNTSRLPAGTTDVVEKLHRDSKGKPDFVAEFNIIRHELIRLGLRK